MPRMIALMNVEGHAMLRRKIDPCFFAQPLRPGNGNGMTLNSLLARGRAV